MGKRAAKPEPTKKAALIESSDEEEDVIGGEEEEEDEEEDEFDGEMKGTDADEKNGDDSFFWDKDDDEKEGSFERKARLLDQAKKQEEADAEEELQTNMAAKEKFVLPSGQEVEKEKIQPPDLAIIRQRMDSIISVLAKFNENRCAETA